MVFQASLGKTQVLITKITKAKHAGGEAVEYLPSKCKVLSSNTSSAPILRKNIQQSKEF
jgi:hypothetical protein